MLRLIIWIMVKTGEAVRFGNMSKAMCQELNLSVLTSREVEIKTRRSIGKSLKNSFKWGREYKYKFG